MRLAITVQRFGSGVDGGAELHCRWLAHRLATRHEVTVLTSTARDYRTWDAHFPPGEERDGPVRVVRFAVAHPRHPEFDEHTRRLLAGEPGAPDEETWLEQQGPVCPDLSLHLSAGESLYDALLVYTYLYHPAVASARAWRGPLILVPTAHDEPVAGLALFQELYRRADGLLFLTPEEEEFVRAAYAVGGKPARTVGVGIGLPQGPEPGQLMDEYGLSAPYVLYMGRIEPGKGCAALLEHHARYREAGGDASLVLAGRLHMELPDEPWLRFLGFVPEDHKRGLYRGAAVIAAPSPFESLSILALEGMACGRPVVANQASRVLVGHCIRSGGGLFYADAEEYAACLARLDQDPGLAERLGAGGRRYVQEHYRWDRVLDGVDQVLRSVTTSTR